MVARQWFGFLGGPIAWLLHLNLSYLLVAIGCNLGWRATDTMLLLLTLLFVGVAGASLWISYTEWRRDRQQFYMAVGAPTAGLFLLLILLNGLAPFLVPTCNPT